MSRTDEFCAALKAKVAAWPMQAEAITRMDDETPSLIISIYFRHGGTTRRWLHLMPAEEAEEADAPVEWSAEMFAGWALKAIQHQIGSR